MALDFWVVAQFEFKLSHYRFLVEVWEMRDMPL